MAITSLLTRPLIRRAALAGCALLGLAVVVPAYAQDRSPPSAERRPAQPDTAQEAAQQQNLPSAEQVLQKYVEATGGEAEYRKGRSQHAVGKFALPAMGLEGSFEQWAEQPDKMLVVVDLAGMGQIRTGLKGDVGWHVDSMQGPRLLEGEELASMKRDSNIESTLNPQEFYQSMEVKGVEEVDGQQAYHLSMLPKDSKHPIEAWYGVESGLLLKTATAQESPMGVVRVETRLEDYAESTGEVKIKQPRKVTTNVQGQQFVITMEKLETNPDVPAGTFDPPAEIQQLIDRQKEQPPAPAGGMPE